jgi:hypothetical protein
VSRYPNELDNDVDLPSISDNITEVAAETINALRSSIFAIQSALGENPQGAASDLKTRLSYFFNDDGTPKQSALVAAGLIALPINNGHIASNAGIEESKLDLDYPTQTLQNAILSNDTDIAELQNLYNQILFDITQHFLGNANKHDGYDITLSGLAGAPSVDSVSLAIHYIWSQFLGHKAALSSTEHYASAIAYTPAPLGPITATNVQDAISQIDTAFYEDRRRHDDSAHSNGISRDGYISYFGQFAVNDASAMVSRLPSSPNILKIGLINSAVIKSKGFNANGVSLTSNTLKIDASTGNGIFRSLTVTGLQSAQYPTGYTHLSLKAIVDYLNQKFTLPANHFPVTAFESPDGELVLQHNISDPSCVLMVSSSSNSAATTLGFSDVLNVPSGHVDHHYLVVDGYRHNELATLAAGAVIHGSTSSSVDLGTITGPGGLGILGNTLFHVYNHTDPSANGTYRIVGTIVNTITLNTPLTAGTFNYIIYKDVIDSNFAGNYKTIDLYINSELEPTSSVRQETTLVQVSGLKIVEVSQDFETTSASMTLDFSSPTYSIYLTISGANGTVTTFEQGFRGYKRVYAPNNVSYITVFIHDPSPAVGTDQITFYSTEKQDDMLLLGVTHTNATSVIEMPLDRRNIGLAGASAIGTEVSDGIWADDIKNLHANGIIRGFDIIQIDPGSLSITLNGGLAYVEGRKIQKSRASIDVTNVAISDGDWNLVLSDVGNIEIYSNTAPGFSVEDILSGTGYVILAQLIISGGLVTSYTDGRFFINDVESKMDLIVDDQDFGSGQFRTLESAVLNSKFSPNNNKPEIKIISDLIINNDVTIDSDTKITAYRDVTINGNLTLSAGANFQTLGALNVTGTTAIGTDCTFSVGGGTLTSISLNTGSVFTILKDTTVSNIDVGGDNVSIIGNINRPSITFDGTSSGIRLIASRSNIIISNIELIMTYSTNPIISTVGGITYDNIIIDNNIFRQSTAFTYPSPTTSRQGIYVASTISNLIINGNIFKDLSHGIEINNSTFSLSNISIRNNLFTSVYQGITISTTSGTANGIEIEQNIFKTIFNYFTRITSNTSASLNGIMFAYNLADNGGISYLSTSMLDTNFGCGSVMCTSNISTGPFISMGSASSVISNNILDGATASIISTSTTTVISNNIVRNNTSLGLSIGGSTTAEILGNIFSTTATGPVYSFSIGSTITCIGNRFTDGGTTSSTFLIPNGAFFMDNVVQSGRIYMSGGIGGRQSITANNRFVANGLNGTNTFEILPGTSATELAIFSNNIIEASGALSGTIPAVRVSTTGSCKLVFSGNAIRSTTGGSILEISNVSNQATLVSGNHLFYSGASVGRGTSIKCSNVYYVNNMSEGVFNTAEIDVPLSSTNIFISNNILNGTGVGGKVINISGTATSVIARNNKNAVEPWTYSAVDALQNTTSDWALNISLPSTIQLESATTSGSVIIPLSGLPVGARIENVQAYVTTPGAAGTLTLRLFRRATGSHGLTEIGSAINNSPSIFQIMTTGTLSHNILSSNEYLVVLTSTATNNIIGQVVANIRI